MMDASLVPTLVRAVAALAFTVGLIAGTAWLLRRYHGLPANRGAAPRLKVLEKKPLNATTTLYLVQHDDHEHLIAATGTQSTLLHTKKTPGKKK